MLEFDVLDFVAMADQSKGLGFSRQTHNLGAFDLITPPDPVTGVGKWNRIKGPKGYPWDIKLFDANFIYDWITEYTWGDPRTYKKFVMNRIVNNKQVDGLLMLPRHIPIGFQAPPPLITPNERTGYWTYKDCKSDKTTQFLGNVAQYLVGPVLVDHLGDVGLQPTLIHEYVWGNTKEENFFVLNYGWTRWSESGFDAATGLYKLNKNKDGSDKMSIHNKLQKGGCPPLNFPCG